MLRVVICAFLSCLWALTLHGQSGDNWKDIKKTGKGKLVCHWFPNDVQVSDSKDIIDGIERDLTSAFISYLEKRNEVTIELQWLQASSFGSVLEKVRAGTGGTFGASSISITDGRAKYINFTEPYMADVAVLMSSAALPVALTGEELKKVVSQGRGISIANTTLLQSLKNLSDTLKANFPIELVESSGTVIEEIGRRDNAFGYVDIVNFLLALENEEKVRRQFFFPVKLKGLALIYPKNSDWEVPVQEYFSSPQFEEDKREILTEYLGKDASNIIEQISRSAEMGPLEEIVLSNREREAQNSRLLEAAKRDREVSILNSILVVLSVSSVIILALVYYLYRMKSQNNSRLLEQQKTIQQKNQQLKQINEEKNNLIQVLAHDLRSPLANIMNAAEVVSADQSIKEEQKKILGFITTSSKKMNSLINKIMDVDAIETGKHNLEIEKVSVDEIVDQVIATQSRKAEDKGIKIIRDVSANLQVKADKLYLAQVLDNLVSNAIKYSEGETKIGFSAKRRSDKIRLSVSDQGPGLTEEDRNKIFMKYQRLSAKPTKGEVSVGLGLSIVKLFTEQMGGEVSFESIHGEGTTFHVDLPQAEN